MLGKMRWRARLFTSFSVIASSSPSSADVSASSSSVSLVPGAESFDAMDGAGVPDDGTVIVTAAVMGVVGVEDVLDAAGVDLVDLDFLDVAVVDLVDFEDLDEDVGLEVIDFLDVAVADVLVVDDLDPLSEAGGSRMIDVSVWTDAAFGALVLYVVPCWTGTIPASNDPHVFFTPGSSSPPGSADG